MNVRPLRLVDKKEVDKIYDDYYSDNEYPDFFKTEGPDRFHCTFAVEDDSGKIIVAGGIKTIAEAVVVTDKSLPPTIRLDALLQALGSSIFIAQGMKYQQIHAFVNHDDKYVNTLQKFGFKLIDAKLLILNFGEPNGQAETA